jgi:hypothetical protein
MWMNTYNPAYWKLINNKWVTKGPWAGYTYEQGAFIYFIKPKISQYIHEFPWTFLQSHIPDTSSFILHFAANYKNHIPNYITTNMNFYDE